jgi:hypothetical protein
LKNFIMYMESRMEFVIYIYGDRNSVKTSYNFVHDELKLPSLILLTG